MNKHFLIVSCLILLNSSQFAISGTIKDPIQDFEKTGYIIPSGRIIYIWKSDINHDGEEETLIDLKPTAQELSQEERDSDWNSQTNSERNFTVYIPNKSGYIQSTGTDFGTYAGRGTGLAVDITRCFVGKITQLNRWGVVSIDIEPAGRRTPASATIYAYTLEGDHLKVTNLAEYDSDHATSPLYDQYLSDAHRTRIHLEEVTVR